METEYKNQKLQVEVIDIFPEKNSVWIENENNSGEYEIHAPANIRFARKGPATIEFNGANGICYIRSDAPKPAYNGSNSQYKGNTGGFYKKPSQTQTGFKPYNQRNPVNASQYKPEDQESKYIGLTIQREDISLPEFSNLYNELSFAGKWIVATNIFPRKDNDNYNVVLFIKEKKEGLDSKLYLEQKAKVQTFTKEEIESAGYTEEELKSFL
jgi:hypothetical protein